MMQKEANMNQEQRNALFGESTPFSEHKEGDVILARRGTKIKQGTIIHVRAAAPTPVSGKDLPLLYVVNFNEGFPALVKQTEIIEGSFPAILGTYGYAENGCTLSRKAAENLAVNVVGQIIDTEQGRLRVLSARLEGDEKAGQVVAECEAVSE